MPYMLQLSADIWLNMDQVTAIVRDGQTLQVTMAGQTRTLNFATPEADALAYYLGRHGQPEAYNQTTKQAKRATPPPGAPERD